MAGTGFGWWPSLHINGVGISWNVTNWHDDGPGSSWLTANVSVASWAPTHPVQVSVISNGYWGGWFQGGPGQQPASPQAGTLVAAAPVSIKVTSNGTQIPAEQTAYINSTPQMPNIQARLVYPDETPASGTATFKLIVSYQSSSSSFPNGPASTVSWNGATNEFWSPPDLTFVGGDAVIQWTFNGGPVQTFNFKIRGQNPAQSTILDRVSTAPWWFAPKIALQESNASQFCEPGRINAGNCAQGSNAGLPAGDSAGGYGVMQLTNPAPSTAQKWNWQMNVDQGLVVLQQKTDAGHQAWRNRVIEWHNWNVANPGNQKPVPADRTEGSCSFTLSPLGQSPWTTPTASAPYWFGDAVAIKRYNSATLDYIVWRNTGDFALDPHWEINELNNANPPRNYVLDVCTP